MNSLPEELGIEQLTDAQVSKQLNACVPLLDQLNLAVNEALTLNKIRADILRDGVTPAICADNREMMWERYQFDIGAFENCSNEDVHKCLKGLQAAVRPYYCKISRSLREISRWFDDTSLMRYYTSAMAYYHRQIDALYNKCSRTINTCDPSAYNQLKFTGYNYVTWESLLTTISEINNTIKQITIPYDLSTMDPGIFTTLNDKLIACGMSVEGNNVEESNLIGSYTSSMELMGWNLKTVFNAKTHLSNTLFKNPVNFSRLKWAVVKGTSDWANHVDQLTKDNHPVEDTTFRDAQAIKNTCTILKHMLQFTMRYSSALSAEWCQLMRMTEDAQLD